MRLVPVLDLQDGQVVRGIAGRRHEYRPLVSPLVQGSDPLDVARAFRDHFGLITLYLADLDAIAGRPPALPLYESLHREGFSLAVDAGMRKTHDAESLVRAGIHQIIAGLETLAGPDELQIMARTFGADRLVFSLDLKVGQALGSSAWGTRDPFAIAQQAVAMGVMSILVLDLSRVGVGDGIGTDDLCVRLRQSHPHLEITAGGGVRGRDDLNRLHRIPVNNVLIASAFHDGRITRADVDALASSLKDDAHP